MNARHIHQIICQKKRKKLRILKMKLKVRWKYSDKNSCLKLKLYWSVPGKCFVSFTNTIKVSGSPINLALCIGKKIVTIRHTNQIIWQKCVGGNHAFSPMFKINQSLPDLLRQKMYFICYERTKPEAYLKSFVVAYCYFEPLFQIFVEL